MKLPLLKRIHLAFGLIFAPAGFYALLDQIQTQGRVDGYVNLQNNLNRERRRKLARRRRRMAK